MARMYPAEPDPKTPASEKVVFDAFRDQLPREWHVLHSRRFLLPRAGGRKVAVEGEVDFLVLDPARGYLGLEVKGGSIERDGADWYSTDQHGVRHRIKDPGAQAQHAVHAIRAYLSQHPGVRAEQRFLSSGFGVVFPHVRVAGDLGPDLPRAIVVDELDLADAHSSVDRIFAARGIHGPGVSPHTERAFLEALAPRLNLARSIASRLEEDWPLLVGLTEEQLGILDYTGSIARLAVEGAAGTGKTLVALEHAKRLTADGARVLFLCFNKLLADHLAAHVEGLSVRTFHELCREMAQSAGIPFCPPQDPAGDNSFWETTAPEVLIEALQTCPDERWDAVVVDEGQDFREYWWLAVEATLRDPKRGALWVFYDPNQNLWGGGPTAALGLEKMTLRWNCRNTARIAGYASKLVDLVPELRPNAPDGVEVMEVDCADEAEMVEAVRKQVHRLVVDEHVEPKRILVMSAASAAASPVRRAQRFGNLSLVDYPAIAGPNQVAFSTLQRFKGLEADVIVLCDVDTTKHTGSPRHLYVGTSRARLVLVVARYRRAAR